VSADDLVLRMTIARCVVVSGWVLMRMPIRGFGRRLLALSMHRVEVDVEVWDRAKKLDAAVKERVRARGV
jgi:hypothetical protein